MRSIDMVPLMKGELPGWVEYVSTNTHRLLTIVHECGHTLTTSECAFINWMTLDLLAELRKVKSETHKLAERALVHWTGDNLKPMGIIEDTELIIHAITTEEDRAWHTKIVTALEFLRILALQAQKEHTQ